MDGMIDFSEIIFIFIFSFDFFWINDRHLQYPYIQLFFWHFLSDMNLRHYCTIWIELCTNLAWPIVFVPQSFFNRLTICHQLHLFFSIVFIFYEQNMKVLQKLYLYHNMFLPI